MTKIKLRVKSDLSQYSGVACRILLSLSKATDFRAANAVCSGNKRATENYLKKWMVTFLKFLRVSLIVSNLLCFCLGILLFIFVFLLAGHAPSFSPKLGGWVAGTSLLSITNLVALFYLFNRLKPGVIKSIFTVINVINAIGYVMAFRRISMILNNYGARLSIGPEYAIWVKVLVFLPCFFVLLD